MLVHLTAASLALLALLAGAAPALPVEKEAPIQPGAIVFTPGGRCTMNFVFADATDLYVGTAGHCAEAVGERASTVDRVVFGTVVYDGEFEGSTTADFALLRIDEAMRGFVDPSVARWGGPIGVETLNLPGTVTLQYGHGQNLGEHDETRGRIGVLLFNDLHGGFVTSAPATPGDSGSPVLSGQGLALGIIQGVEVGFSVGIGELPGSATAAVRSGPTVAQILADLDAAGIEVEVVTAPFQPLHEQLLEDLTG